MFWSIRNIDYSLVSQSAGNVFQKNFRNNYIYHGTSLLDIGHFPINSVRPIVPYPVKFCVNFKNCLLMTLLFNECYSLFFFSRKRIIIILESKISSKNSSVRDVRGEEVAIKYY
jgi:hypothetical protein